MINNFEQLDNEKEELKSNLDLSKKKFIEQIKRDKTIKITAGDYKMVKPLWIFRPFKRFSNWLKTKGKYMWHKIIQSFTNTK